jgi:hypothetical protein
MSPRAITPTLLGICGAATLLMAFAGPADADCRSGQFFGLSSADRTAAHSHAEFTVAPPIQVQAGPPATRFFGLSSGSARLEPGPSLAPETEGNAEASVGTADRRLVQE